MDGTIRRRGNLPGRTKKRNRMKRKAEEEQERGTPSGRQH